MNKNYFEDLEKLGIYEEAFKNWCSDYENLVYQKFEEHCDSFDIFFDVVGNVSWEDGDFISEQGNEDDPKFKLNDLNSNAQNKALNDWVYSYSDILYGAFESYAKAFKLYFDDNGNILGEDE